MNIPEMVFINCCHLGKFSSADEDKTPRYAFNDFAASLSEQLIDMGVKGVIAAGWAVDDAAALTFAEVFYERLLKGDYFGDAVKAPRVETFTACTKTGPIPGAHINVMATQLIVWS